MLYHFLKKNLLESYNIFTNFESFLQKRYAIFDDANFLFKFFSLFSKIFLHKLLSIHIFILQF